MQYQLRWILIAACLTSAACGGAEPAPHDNQRPAALDTRALRSERAAGGEAAPVAAGEWNCSATIGAEAAQRAVAASRESIEQCYQQVTDGTNPPEGRLVVHARVGADGRVTDILSGGSLRQPQVVGCMVRVVAKWTFERPESRSCAVVTVPFRFGRKRTFWLNGG